MQNLEDQKRQNKQQYTLIKKRQKILSDKTKTALGKLEDQKDAALKSKDNVLYDRLLAKGQLISKCPFGVFKLTKKPTKLDFCPSL